MLNLWSNFTVATSTFVYIYFVVRLVIYQTSGCKCRRYAAIRLFANTCEFILYLIEKREWWHLVNLVGMCIHVFV